jgi:hypothetical protein
VEVITLTALGKLCCELHERKAELDPLSEHPAFVADGLVRIPAVPSFGIARQARGDGASSRCPPDQQWDNRHDQESKGRCLSDRVVRSERLDRLIVDVSHDVPPAPDR